jgi:4-diphosphocytidyl-2-C-methyl-D-erythritol kinase
VTQKRGIDLYCDDPSLENSGNLALRAARKLAEHVELDPCLAIHLRKSIPVGSGLGGGSSDAAATLRICNRLWETGLSDEQLAVIGAEIGSDVPMFFSVPSAVVTGRGEQVKPIRLSWAGWALLAFAGPLVPTQAVYAAWSPSDSSSPWGVEERLLEATSAESMNECLFNDLEPAIFRVAPQVKSVRDRLDQAGFGPVRVSGAGSALFRMYDDCESARRAAKEIQRLAICPRVELAAVPVGAGPLIYEENEQNGSDRGTL